MKNRIQQPWDHPIHKAQLTQKLESHRRDLRMAGDYLWQESFNIRFDVDDLISGALQPAARASWPNLENLTIEVKI